MHLESSCHSALPKVGVLGPFGTYSHEAAYDYFGEDAQYEEIETIGGVFDSLSSGKLDYGLVPQENSIFGSVIETYDALRFTNECFVRGETSLRIDHCLLVRSGVDLRDVETVLSHEQALGQCREFVESNLPQASTEKTTSTAAAARALLDRPPTCAAISSRVCVTLFDGLEIAREAIQKEKVNYTRFFVLARNRHLEVPSSPASHRSSRRKAMFRIRIRDTNGGETAPNVSISTVLRNLPDDLDVSRIDRRPAIGEAPFSNVFFIEVRGQPGSMAQGEAAWAGYLGKFVAQVQAIGLRIDITGSW